MMINKFFSMAALAIVGAVMASCSSDNNNNEVVTPPQPVKTDKLVTLTASVSLDNSGAGTRALDASGNKTFAEGDKIAVIYKKSGGSTEKAESDPLAAGGSQATFTVTLDDPDRTQDVTYIYPASMANSDGTPNYDALATQDGTLGNIGSNLDYCTKSGGWNAGALPNLTLENQLAICGFKLKDATGTYEINENITRLVLKDGTNTYTVTRSAVAADFIYVAIRPTVSKTIRFEAATATKSYAKYLENKTYAAGNMYELGLKMAEVIKGKFSVSSTKQVYFSKGNLQATGTVVGSTTTWTWAFAEHQWDKIGGKDQSGAGTPTGNNKIIGDGKLSDSGTVDLFGWSTGATYLGINNSTENSTYSGDFADWGSNEDVIAGIGSGWRTLTRVEWEYLLDPKAVNHRTGMQYYKAQVNGVNGLIVFPDDWSDSYHPLTKANVNNNAISFESTKIDESTWTNDFEANGAVFLPVAGQRHVNNDYVEYPNGRGHYWSSTPYDAGTAFRVYFTGSSSEWSYGVSSSRRFGYAVRLVYDIK